MSALPNEELYAWIVRAIVLVTALPVHECAHAYVASRLGDNTARDRGRLTLNPFVHLDLLGSLLLIFAGFGWAKPVPIDPRNFEHPRRDMALSALAGPISNFLYAFLLLLLVKILGYTVDIPALRYVSQFAVLMDILLSMVLVNLYLFVFNFLPIPPLDGSKILGALLPDRIYFTIMQYERYISLVLFFLIFFGVLSTPLSYIANQCLRLLFFLTRPIDLLLG